MISRGGCRAGDHDFKAGQIIRSHYGGFFTPTLYGQFIFAQNKGSNIDNYLNAIATPAAGRPEIPPSATTDLHGGYCRTAGR
jgi:hypothetical protein